MYSGKRSTFPAPRSAIILVKLFLVGTISNAGNLCDLHCVNISHWIDKVHRIS